MKQCYPSICLGLKRNQRLELSKYSKCVNEFHRPTPSRNIIAVRVASVIVTEQIWPKFNLPWAFVCDRPFLPICFVPAGSRHSSSVSTCWREPDHLSGAFRDHRAKHPPSFCKKNLLIVSENMSVLISFDVEIPQQRSFDVQYLKSCSTIRQGRTKRAVRHFRSRNYNIRVKDKVQWSQIIHRFTPN